MAGAQHGSMSRREAACVMAVLTSTPNAARRTCSSSACVISAQVAAATRAWSSSGSGEDSLFAILPGQQEGRDQHLISHGVQGMSLDVVFDDFRSLFLIPR